MNHPLLKLITFVLCTSLLSLAGLAYGADRDCTTATHCALMELAPWHEDREEDPRTRYDRLWDHSLAIESVTDNKTERAWLIQTAWNETKLARFVDFDEDKCRLGIGGWCDSGRAFGVTQLHDTDRDLIRAEQYAEALKRFRRAANYCVARGHDYWTGGTAQYGSGKHGVCTWKNAEKRVVMMRKIEGRL